MRIPDAFMTNPTAIIIGWVTAIILVSIIVKVNPDFENKDISKYAVLGAYVFVLQTIPIPFIIPVLPFPLTLSGIPLVLTIMGVRKGLLISVGAVILNHLFIPGALSMLGLNLTNLILAGLLVGYLSSQIYHKMGRRLRYIGGFFAGIIYILGEGVLIFLEYVLTHQIPDISFLIYGFSIYFLFLGIIEGFFTAVASSYYYRDNFAPLEYEYTGGEDSGEEEEVSPIDFLSAEDEY